MAYSIGADHSQKHKQLNYGERESYFMAFKQAMATCGERDVEPVRKMLHSMGEKRDAFIKDHGIPPRHVPLLGSVKKNKVAVFGYLLQQGACSEDNKELVYFVMKCVGENLNSEFIDCLVSFGFDVRQHASVLVDSVLSTKEKSDEYQNNIRMKCLHLRWGVNDSDEEDSEEDSEESDCSDEEFDDYYDDEILDCDFCPYYKKMTKEDEIISGSLYKQQMKMVERILQLVDPNVKGKASHFNEPEKIQALILNCKHHSVHQRLQMLELAHCFGLRMNKTIERELRGTLLHKAVNNVDGNAVKSLVKNGADVNYKNRDGLDPVQAYYKGKDDEERIQTKSFFDIFRYLLEKGLKVRPIYFYMVAFHKTYIDYKTGIVFKRGYETELNYIVLHHEICLLAGNRFDMGYEEFFYELSLPLLCTLMQAGYDMETFFSAICLKGLSTNTSVVFDLAFWAHPWMFKKLKPDYDSVIEDLEDFQAAKKRPIYSYFRKLQSEVPSLLQLSVFCIRQHVQTVMNAKNQCQSYFKCSVSILPRLSKLRSRLPEKVVHLLTLHQFYIERDPQKTIGGSLDARTPAERMREDRTTFDFERLTTFMNHMSGPPTCCTCHYPEWYDPLHVGINY